MSPATACSTSPVDAARSTRWSQNGGLIRADGGRVLLTAQAAGQLLHTVVNNTGMIEARTIENRNGTILLLGDMQIRHGEGRRHARCQRARAAAMAASSKPRRRA